MASNPVPIRAHLKGIDIVGSFERNGSNKQDYFVVISVDDREVAKSKKNGDPTLIWRWNTDDNAQFWFHPSSTFKIKIYRQIGTYIIKHLVGQQLVGEQAMKVTELIESDMLVDLKNLNGVVIAPKVKISITLVPNDFKSFMKSVDENASRLENLSRSSTLNALDKTFQVTKSIMDSVADAHPILKTSWIVISTVYKAVQQTELLDEGFRDLAESLRETLGVAKELPSLAIIEGTDNVIEEIGRTSLNATSLIHEYANQNFTRRALNSQLSEDMKLRLDRCQKACTDLKEKLDRRVNISTNLTISHIRENGVAVRNAIERVDSAVTTITNRLHFSHIQLWLGASDSSRNYNEARRNHQANTCDWFLNGRWFRDFQNLPELFWLKGTAGCGKTILCSSIIAKIIELCLEQPQIAYAYFFFDGRDSQKDLRLHEKFIRSLILQLSLQCAHIPDQLTELYGHGHQQPALIALHDTLYDIIKNFDSVYIIIDSLDECIDRGQTLLWIKQIISRRVGNLHMLVASRPERDIIDTFYQLTVFQVDVAAEMNRDIVTYLDQQLSLVEKWDRETRQVVKTALIKGAQGMFRWVALQLLELKKCSSQHAVISQLKNLPTGLYETYDRILAKIDEQNNERTDARILLLFLCFAVRPMTLSEISDAVAVDFSVEDNPWYDSSRRYWDSRDVLDKCSGFIVEWEGKVKVAHFSIKEYLLSDHLSKVENISVFHFSSDEHAHSIVSQTCLAYLLQFDKPDSLTDAILSSSHLIHYASEHWITHAKAGGIDNYMESNTLDLAKKLFTQKNNATLTNWLRVWHLEFPEHSPNLGWTTSNIATPLYYASLAGMMQLSRYLLTRDPEDEISPGGRYETALQAASARGHDAIVRLLLEKGTALNRNSGYYTKALYVASEVGHTTTVTLLLEKLTVVDMNAPSGPYGNALHVASARGHISIVDLLLQWGVDVNGRGGWFGTAIQAASLAGHDPVVETLVQWGANVNVEGGYFSSALIAASWKGHTGIVELLLQRGADVNTRHHTLGTALTAAVRAGHDMIIKLLLDNGADINAQAWSMGNLLQAASARGQNTVVQLLLDNGADVNAQGGQFGNALQAASTNGHAEIAKLLIGKGADTSVQDDKMGELPPGERLDETDTQDGRLPDPFEFLLEEGPRYEIYQAPIDKGEDLDDEVSVYANELWEAAAEQYDAIVLSVLDEDDVGKTKAPSVDRK